MGTKIRQARFHVEMHNAMERINDATHFDNHLYAEDIEASQAHCRMLVARNIISKKDGESIIKGLAQIREEIDRGDFTFDPKLEDVHMNIEHRLHELIGNAAGRLHTARSRNDQVATDFRLYIRRGIETLETQIKELQNALVDVGEQHAATIMPGFTHLQPAQPVTFGHHLLAYVEMFERDRIRFANARENLNESPLGACALAGTSFPIDPKQTADTLGFRKPCGNSIDAVSDRDFVLETLAAASIAAMHLSRLAEEIVLWSSALVGFIRLSDAYSTGSSIMPQKRNPDAAELIRGKTGRIVGGFVSLLMVMKGLPLSYSKDMQEDKEPLFDALDSLGLGIAAMCGMVRDMTPNPDTMRAASATGFSTATDLADWLVRKHSLPFREAHKIVGELVGIAEARGVNLEELSLQEFQKVDARINESALKILNVEDSVASRTSPGGTSPENVTAAIACWRKHLCA